jgi:hypothetical protein
MNSRSDHGFKTQKFWPRVLSGDGPCSVPPRSESPQNAFLDSLRNMSEGLAKSSQEKSRRFQPQELRIERRGEVQEVSTALIMRANRLGRCARLWLKNNILGGCACHCRDRETARSGHCRPTNRCSGPPTIKCLAAGVDLPTTSPLPRARVLTRQLAAAELSR